MANLISSRQIQGVVTASKVTGEFEVSGSSHTTGSFNVTGSISASSTITANNFVGDGSTLSGVELSGRGIFSGSEQLEDLGFRSGSLITGEVSDIELEMSGSGSFKRKALSDSYQTLEFISTPLFQTGSSNWTISDGSFVRITTSGTYLLNSVSYTHLRAHET